MRKCKLFLVLLLVAAYAGNGYAQVLKLNGVSLVEFDRLPNGLARFYEPGIKDSLVIRYTTEIKLKYPLGEKNEENEISSILITKMLARNPITRDTVFVLSADKKIIDKWEQDFWNRYSEYIIKDWYKNLPRPYESESQIYEYKGLKMIRYGGGFIVTPKK